MSPRSKAAYLWEVADACAAVQEFISGRTLEDYRGNRMLRIPPTPNPVRAATAATEVTSRSSSGRAA